MVADPPGDILCRGIDVQYFVDILVVKSLFYDFLDMREVRHHAVLVKLFCFAINHDDPVVAMQLFAFALVRQH